MDNTKITIKYSEIIEIQYREETKHVEKEFNKIPLNIVKAIETLLENYKNEL